MSRRISPRAQTATLQQHLWLGLGLLTLTIFFLCGAGIAHAQGTIDAASGMNEVEKNIGNNIKILPRLIAVIAYVIGTFFTAAGLLRLKDWINDSERNTLNASLFRLMVGALLIMLPHIFGVVNSTFWGSDAEGETQNTGLVTLPAPQLNVFCKSADKTAGKCK